MWSKAYVSSLDQTRKKDKAVEKQQELIMAVHVIVMGLACGIVEFRGHALRPYFLRQLQSYKQSMRDAIPTIKVLMACHIRRLDESYSVPKGTFEERWIEVMDADCLKKVNQEKECKPIGILDTVGT